MFRVIIAGGRDFANYALLTVTMDKLLSKTEDEIIIICGGARGADSLGADYATDRGYAVRYYIAQWDQYGKSAGYRRNEQMAQNADALVAFWDGKSRGTKHMIDLARKYGLKIRVIHYDETNNHNRGFLR